jgi:hypothetical protein
MSSYSPEGQTSPAGLVDTIYVLILDVYPSGEYEDITGSN